MRIIRNIGISILALLALLVVALVVLQMAANPNDYKALLQQRAAEQQIDLNIAGNIHWSFLPRPAIVAENIDVVLPLDGKRQPLHIAKVNVVLELASLLHRKVVVSRFEIKDASMSFENSGAPQHRLQAINFLAQDFKRDGSPFPVMLSLIYGSSEVQIPIQLSGMLSLNMQDQKFVRAMLDQIDMTWDRSSHVTGSVLWQQGSPSRTVINLNSEKLLAKHLQLTNVSMSAIAEGDKVNLGSLRAELYQGQIHASGILDVSGSGNAKWQIDTVVKDVQLPALITDWDQKQSALSAGILQLDTRLTTVPSSKGGLLGSLSGTAQFSIAAAALDGDNIEKQACEAAAKLDNKSLSARKWSAKTEFRDISGTAKISNGIAWFAPVRIKLDTLDIVGSGPVNLVNSTLNVPLDMKMLSNNQAVNACEILNPRLTDINWPLRCEGNYAQQTGGEMCGIDKSRMSTLLLRAAQEKLQSRLDGKDEKIKDMLKALLH